MHKTIGHLVILYVLVVTTFCVIQFKMLLNVSENLENSIINS